MAGGFGGASFGSPMGYSYYGMPNYKGKMKKSWFVKSPLTWKYGMKKTKSKGKNPGAHRINGDNMLMPKGYEKVGKMKMPSVPKKVRHNPGSYSM